MLYDFIVLGGGISGLYCTYLLLQKFPKKSILLLEKSSTVGGRIYTYSDKYMEVEAGAGRFNKKHILLMNLLRELTLHTKIVPISSDMGYAPSDNSEPKNKKILTGKSVLSHMYISKVVKASKREPISLLQNMSFLDYANTILPKNELEYIRDSFGYYSELVIMNAYDAIHLMRELTPDNEFMVLRGGLSQITDRLATKIEKHASSRILCNKTVVDIHARTPELGTSVSVRELSKENTASASQVIEIYCEENKRPYLCTQCVCALPKQVAENLLFFKKYNRSITNPLFSQIVCAPLCRIYSVFPLVNGKVWFSGLGKFSTNNHLRMVIPVSEEKGVIMISYSDNKYADGWNNLYNTKGIRAVDIEIAKLIKQSTGIDIPRPLITKVFYWKCGVGYWGIGADSSGFPLQPIETIPIYLCGEHYSATSQQWIEGSLETADRVAKKIMDR